MMSRTHLSVGMAASLVFLQPQNISDCMFVLAGGAIGGVLADIDILDNLFISNTLIVQLSAFGILGTVCMIDSIFQLGAYDSMIHKNPPMYIIGIILLLLLWIKGVASRHRDFTHSIAAMILFSAGFFLIYPWLGTACFAGYCSHLILDLLNKKKLRLFYPLSHGICFKLCYADKTANKIFMHTGFTLTFLIFIAKMLMLL